MGETVPAMISTMGFDVDHIIVLYAKYSFDKLILLIPRGADIRTYNAVEALRKVFQRNVIVEEVEIDYRHFANAVSTVREIMKNNLPCYINLSGGMRVLVIETLIAYITLPQEDRRKILNVFVVVEGTKDVIEIDLKTLAATSRVDLTVSEQLVYEIFKSVGTLTVKSVLEELRRRGYDYSRAWLYRVLRKLMEKDLVEQVGRGVYRVRT